MLLNIVNFPDGLKKLVREEIEAQKYRNTTEYTHDRVVFMASESIKGFDYWCKIQQGNFIHYYGVCVVNVKLKI